MRRSAALATLLACLLLAALARGEIVQQQGFRVAVDASFAPTRLPGKKMVPVRFTLSTRVIPRKGEDPPQLRRIEVAINRHARLSSRGLPVCRIDQIQPSTTANAINACRGARVGEGYFSADVRLTQQAPFPSEGRLVAFNGRWHSKPAILAHIYGAKPAPTSTTIPFLISNAGKGEYGTSLSATLPRFSGRWGYVTAISISLGRRYSYRGEARSYLSAACPTPNDVPIASFPLSRARFAFTGAARVDQTLIRSCRRADRPSTRKG